MLLFLSVEVHTGACLNVDDSVGGGVFVEFFFLPSVKQKALLLFLHSAVD